MRKTIATMRKMAERLKVLAGFMLLVLTGALIAIGAMNWHYSGRMSAYDRQVVRLYAEIDEERGANRVRLNVIANQSASNTQTLAEIAERLEQVAKKVGSAATTAKSAANTARTAAKSAAQPKITITEVRPSPAMKRQSVKTREVEP